VTAGNIAGENIVAVLSPGLSGFRIIRKTIRLKQFITMAFCRLPFLKLKNNKKPQSKSTLTKG